MKRWNRSGKLGLGLALLAGAAVLAGVAEYGPARLALFRLRQGLYYGQPLAVQAPLAARQDFISQYPGLTAVAVQITDPLPADDQPVTWRLIELSAPPVERVSITRPLGEVRGAAPGQLIFEFAPLDDSAGRRYAFSLETPGPAPLRVVGHSGDVYSLGAAAHGGDLMFEIYYNGLWGPTLRALGTRLAAQKTGWLGNPWFYAGLGGCYGVALLGLLWVGRRSVSRPAAPPLSTGPAPGR